MTKRNMKDEYTAALARFAETNAPADLATVNRIQSDILAAAAAINGRKGGSSTSPAKRAASAANGRKGGRPRKLSTTEKRTASKTAKQA